MLVKSYVDLGDRGKEHVVFQIGSKKFHHSSLKGGWLEKLDPSERIKVVRSTLVVSGYLELVVCNIKTMTLHVVKAFKRHVNFLL